MNQLFRRAGRDYSVVCRYCSTRRTLADDAACDTCRGLLSPLRVAAKSEAWLQRPVAVGFLRPVADHESEVG